MSSVANRRACQNDGHGTTSTDWVPHRASSKPSEEGSWVLFTLHFEMAICPGQRAPCSPFTPRRPKRRGRRVARESAEEGRRRDAGNGGMITFFQPCDFLLGLPDFLCELEALAHLLTIASLHLR